MVALNVVEISKVLNLFERKRTIVSSIPHQVQGVKLGLIQLLLPRPNLTKIPDGRDSEFHAG